MGAKFDQIFESVVSRYQTGGFLVGDVVNLKSNYQSSECCKHMHDQMKYELDQLAKSGLNIIVTKIGDTLSGASAGNQFKDASVITVTIAGDQGGGRHYGQITVTPDMLELADGSPTLPVPDQFKRKDVVIIKPQPVEDDENHITRVTDKGNGKNTPTQLKLGESAVISRDTDNLAMLYENINSDDVDYTLIYEKVLYEEGWLRRMATKFAGGGKSNPLQKNNQAHQFAQSAALEIGKDISKSFGGDYNAHAKALYKSILDYVSKVP